MSADITNPRGISAPSVSAPSVSARSGSAPSISATSISAPSSRRTFLLAGSALVAGAALLRREAAIDNGGLSTLATSPGPRLGVGYVEGSAGVSTLAEMLASGRSRVVPASTLVSGDLGNQAAALVVHGFSPGVPCDDTCSFDNVFVDAHLPSPDPSSAEATIPFYAWTFRRAPAMASGRTRFIIGPARGLRVGFTVTTMATAGSTPTPATPTTTTAATVFTSGRLNLSGLPQLQRGIYLLGVNHGAWTTSTPLPAADDPKWSDLASIVVSVDAA